MKINEDLKRLYINKFSSEEPCVLQQLRAKRCFNKENERPAYPLLLKVDERSLAQADLKIMIFGQETNTWETRVCDEVKNVEESKDIIAKIIDEYGFRD